MENGNFMNVMKNVTPAIFVMAVGLLGAYFVYGTYVDGISTTQELATAESVATIEPAAGIITTEETTVQGDIDFETYDPFAGTLPQPDAYETIPNYKDIDMGE